MNETYVTVNGRLVADPVVKRTHAGVPFAVFRVAQSSRRPSPTDPGEWVDSDPSYYDVTAFRVLGTNCGEALRKGHPVTLTGRQQIRLFTREDGSTGAKVEIEALAVGHDLRWGTTTFVKNAFARAASDPLGQSEVRDALDSELGDPNTVGYVVADPEASGDGEAQGGPVKPGSDKGAGASAA